MLPTITTTAKIQKKYTRVTETSKSITSLQLSVGEKNPKGEYDNFYFDATFWEKSADFVDKNFNEGDFIVVKGDLITTNYAKQDGTKVYKTELKFPKASFVPRVNGTQAPSQDRQPSPQPQPTTNVPVIDVDSDSIPF